ncbi:FAD-dependent oxidoreductase, partial [Arthrobacter mobilis]
ADMLTFRTHQWYADRGIGLAVRERIVQVARDDGGGEAVAESGRVFPFKRLALTTGAAARKIPFEGSEFEGVSYLRGADEAGILAGQLRAARHVAVIGGGFIGLEVAAGARAAGRHVTVIEAAPRLIGRAVSEATSGFYLEAHRRRGTEVILGAAVGRITGRHDRVTGVELADGTVVPAEVVLVGVGAVPRTELAGQLGLAVENGIVVDSRALASDGLTVAAGDCANMPNPFVRDYG